MLGPPLPSLGSLIGIAYQLATQDAPSFSSGIPPHLLWFSGQVTGMGWERTGQLVRKMNKKRREVLVESSQHKRLQDRHVLCAGKDRVLGYRLASNLVLFGKQFKMFLFSLSNMKFSWPMLTVLWFLGCQGFLDLAPRSFQGLGQAMLNSLRWGTYEWKSCFKINSTSQSTFSLPYTKSLPSCDR